jgi:hypothetical protein
MARQPYPSEAADKLLIRFPEGMRAKIEKSAKAAGRSMNAEVIARLEKTLAADESTDGFDVRHEVKRHHSWMVMMMQTLAQSGDKAFDPIRDLLRGMDDAGKKAAAEWFRENENPSKR